MEQKLDELLKQLHRYLFADSEQVIVELRHYTLDRSLKEADLGTSFFSKLIKSPKNPLISRKNTPFLRYPNPKPPHFSIIS